MATVGGDQRLPLAGQIRGYLMRTPPHRTRETLLTDNELLLLDCMFDSNVWERQLNRDSYRLQFNMGYTHALDDRTLKETLASLADRGLVIRSIYGQKIAWSLTPIGGEQWERERKPPWDAYCTDRSGRSSLMVLSTERATAEAFWTIGSKTRLWKVGDKQPRYWRIADNYRLLPWRSFPAIHVLVARGASYEGVDTDWEAYEANRTWWRVISELDRLRRNPT